MKQLFMSASIFFISWLISGALLASSEVTGDYQGRDDVNAFITDFASKSDYSKQALVDLFSQVKKQAHLFERLNRPAEKELQWHQYRKIFIKEKRIAKGAEFWLEHEAMLAEVEAKTGVPAEIIVAIIGVETFYGIYRGKDPVFDSLVTIAFDYPRRAKFFRSELEQFLLLVKEQNLDARSLKGSYAGAMGMPQFISSSYRNYAVDGDGDGRIDLFGNIADITSSVANYFVRHGWRQGEKVARPLIAVADNAVSQLETGIKPRYSWSELKQHGLTSKFRIADDMTSALVRLEQKNHPEYWAGFKNFYVITRYNHSELYAMAAYQLSVLIKARKEGR